MLVDVYTNIRKNFTPDEQRHYQFTPRNIISLIVNLKKYNNIEQTDSLQEALYNEIVRSFRDKLVN